MKKYHINFKVDAEAFYSTGENFEALTPSLALDMFSTKHPDAIFLAMYCVENISKLASHRLAFEESQADYSIEENLQSQHFKTT